MKGNHHKKPSQNYHKRKLSEKKAIIKKPSQDYHKRKLSRKESYHESDY